MKKLGPHFGQELAAAGLDGLVSWDADGNVVHRRFDAGAPELFVDSLTTEQHDVLLNLIDAHDPDNPPVNLVAYAAQKRWEVEVAGTEWNGWPIHTDRESQGKYLSELQAITLEVRQDGEFWKFADDQFRPITNAEMQAMAIAARDHVKGTFALEAAALAAIVEGEATTTAAIDAIFATS